MLEMKPTQMHNYGVQIMVIGHSHTTLNAENVNVKISIWTEGRN